MVTFSLYSGLDLDGALMKPTMNFLQKLSADPTNPSLKIKTLSNAVDKRVRTGRINDQFRAGLFEIKDQDTHHFVLVDVDSHDEGNLKAERLDPARLGAAHARELPHKPGRAGWYFHAEITPGEAASAVLGDEGAELRLMPVAEFVAHPGAVPHFPAIVAEMLELRP